MSIRQDALFDKIKGGLYGVAIGDALGGTTEFMNSREIQAAYGYVTEIIGGGVWGLEPGEVTDDTMMTLCVAEGILENPLDPIGPIGTRFMNWYRSRPKDIGNIIRYTFENYKDNWFEAAFQTDRDLGQSGGNGSLMRCLPAALAYPDLKEVERISRLQSQMTHYDERCSEACVIYNRIAFRLLRGEDLRSAIQLEVTGTEFEGVLTSVPNCEPSGFVVHTFQWVLSILLVSSGFGEVVQKTANLGGDSDAIGTIAGGLAGINFGYSGNLTSYSNAILMKTRLDEVTSRLYRLRQTLAFFLFQ